MTTRTFVPWIVFGIFAAYVAAPAVPLSIGRGSKFEVAAFGGLPVSANGRVQPFDSVARTGLLQIRGPVTALDGFKTAQARPTTIDPVVWLLEVLARPDIADTRRVFPIKSRELLVKLELPAPGRGTNYYAFNDLGPKASEIQKQLQQFAKLKTPDRAPWQEELVGLRDKLVLYERLKNSLLPNSRLQQDANGKPINFDFAAELARYQADLAEALRVDAERRRGSGERLEVATEMRLRGVAALFQLVSRMGMLAVVPRPAVAGLNNDWSNIGTVLVKSALGHQPSEPVAFLAGIASSFAQDKPAAFNSQVARYRQWLAANRLAPEASKARIEAFSNRLLPLVRAFVLYAVALALVVVARRRRSAAVYWSALAMVLLASTLHATGVVFAAMLAGTPSWIVVSGWAIGLAPLVVKRLWRRGNGTVASAAIGLTTLVTAYAGAPGGAANLFRNALDTSLLLAIGAAVFALFVGREWRPVGRPRAAAQATLGSPVA
jgi:hypothetical protein